LRAAIAFETAQNVAGQAFTVQAHQRDLVMVLIADDQRDMLAVVARAKGDDLRVLRGGHGKTRAV
jgi:regulator of RNase E activity RraA